MNIEFHRNFKKQYKKLPQKVRLQFQERLILYVKNPAHPLLNTHALSGEDKPLQSFNVTGDYRALFVQTKTKVTFYKIGTHAKLYG